MKATVNVIDLSLIAACTAWSIDNIESILGVILLIIQICWILAKLVINLVKYLKKGKDIDKLDKYIDEIENTVNNVLNNGERSGEDERSGKNNSKKP